MSYNSFRRILKAMNYGLMLKWTDMHIPPAKKCNFCDGPTHFALWHFESVFLTLIIGTVVSTCVFLMERRFNLGHFFA